LFIELIHNAFLDSTFLYLYLGIFLLSYLVVYASLLYNRNFFQRKYLSLQQDQYDKINVMQIKVRILVNQPFLLWLILLFKRTDEADDQEDSPASYFKQKVKIRGGQLWKEKTYSQELGNMYPLSVF